MARVADNLLGVKVAVVAARMALAETELVAQVKAIRSRARRSPMLRADQPTVALPQPTPATAAVVDSMATAAMADQE